MKVKIRSCDVCSVEDAITNDKLIPDPYTNGSELEELKSRIRLQAEFIAKLVDKLCENGHIKTAQLEEILGYGYEVRMD
jgi:hypothetical protein